MRNVGFKIGCLIQIIYVVLYFALSTHAVIKILSWFGQSVPLWADIVIGFIGGALAVPIWIIGSILRFCGVF
jgi:hypothetical protein